MHEPCSGELIDPLDVDRAPVARAPARRDAIHVALCIDRLPDAIDPPEAQALIEVIGPRDARPARPLLVHAYPELIRRRVVLLEPLPQLVGRRKELRLHRTRPTPAT